MFQNRKFSLSHQLRTSVAIGCLTCCLCFAARVSAEDPTPFRVGDKVLQTVNNYEKEVFNGDVGFVERLGGDGRTLLVRFTEPEDRISTIPGLCTISWPCKRNVYVRVQYPPGWWCHGSTGRKFSP